MKLFLLTLFTLIAIVGLAAGFGLLCLSLVDPVMAYLVTAGSGIIFGTIIFTNTRLMNFFGKYKYVRNTDGSKMGKEFPDAEPN